MRDLNPMTPEQIVGQYGPNWERGLLSDHVEAFVKAGGTVRAAASGSGAQWALLPLGKGMEAIPVVCSEIISVDTEDGPVSGRCGKPSVRHGACDAHAEGLEAYRAMSEAERAFWERQMDGSF